MAEQAVDEAVARADDPQSRRFGARIAVAAAGAVIVVVAGLFVALDSEQHEPAGPSPTPNPSAGPIENRATIPPITDEMVQPVFDPADIDELPWRSGLARSWDPVDAVPLEDDPVERAVVAHQSAWDQPNSISVLGNDGRWRSLNGPDSELAALAPDGTRLALVHTQAVVVVDLTTAERRTYETPRLGPAWNGRFAAWSTDGDTVHVGASFRSQSRGLAIELVSGDLSRVPFAFPLVAFLDDHDVMEIHFRGGKTDVRRYDASGEPELVTVPSHDILGAMSSVSAHGDRIAAVTEQTWSTDAAGKEPRRSGILVMDADARPKALLPVEGFQDNSEAGAVLGWIDDETVLLRVLPDLGADRAAVLAWEIDSGRITRIADHASGGAVSVAASHL